MLFLALVWLSACQSKQEPMDIAELAEFATRYAEAWSGQDPKAFASFYAENGSLTINDGAPSVGRDAVEQTAREFMTAFPDMVVRMVELSRDGERGQLLLALDRDEHRPRWYREFSGPERV